MCGRWGGRRPECGGIRLVNKDELVGTDTVTSGGKDQFFLNMGSKGYGKKTSVKNYRLQNRGGSGIKTFKVTEKTGPLMVARIIGHGEEELIAISLKSQVIRVSLSEIPSLGTANARGENNENETRRQHCVNNMLVKI